MRVRRGNMVVRPMVGFDSLCGEKECFTAFLQIGDVFRDVVEAGEGLSVLIDVEDFLGWLVFRVNNRSISERGVYLFDRPKDIQ